MIMQKISNALARTGKLGKTLIAVLLIAGIASGGAAGYNWYKNHAWPVWPEPAAGDHTPQTQTVVERDYAWRTGDLIKLKLYVEQLPGTTVDPQTLSLGDTFEAAEKPVVTQKKYGDGTVVYRIDLTLQSFKVARDLTFTGNISWKSGDQRNDLALPEKHIYTSNTYDGRKNLMEGPDPRVSLYWYGARYVLPLLAALTVYLLLLVPAVRAWLRSLVKPVVVDTARNRVVALLEAVSNGSCTRDQHLELDGLIRDRFHIGPVPANQIELAMTPPSVIAFLKLNEPAIYSQEALNDKDRAQLCAKGQTILSRWK